MLLKKNTKIILFLVMLGLMMPAGAACAQDKTDAGAPASIDATTAKTRAEKDAEAAALEAAINEVEEKKKEKEAMLEAEAKEDLAAQKLIEEVKAEKESLEQEVKLKEEEATVAQKELEVMKEEAAATNGKDALKETRELEEKVKALQAEAEAQKKRLLLATEKEKIAEKRLAKEQAETDQIREQVQELMVQRSGMMSIYDKLWRSGIVLVIGLLLFLLLRMGIRGLERLVRSKDDVVRESEIELRVKTLGKLFNWLGGIIILLSVVYQFLTIFGFNVAPLLAGAGVVGIAFGFGGQYLIRDIINGMFILIEGQYRINDVVKIGDLGGLVEDINLRITTLRDLAGRVIIIPNGEIKTVINFTRGYAQALLDIGVAYKENVDRVMEVIKEVGREMREDNYFRRLILDDLEMLGVDDYADSAVIIKFRIKTKPIKQWEVSREFRRRLKHRFDELGIEIPFPHRTVYWGGGEDNQWFRDSMGKMAKR